MSEVNMVSLVNQMRIMASQANGGNALEVQSTQPTFSTAFKNAIEGVNNLSQQTDALRTSYELGDDQVSLSQVMIASQKSNLATEATIQVRNKLLQAYHDVMNMPI
ncbi:flagellar hook-basal body complex protein FliE [Legionella sp. W05-934-2]|jgi:flagellar hook-basal body complex protein FliE|uniref:flagellar hook-basal body complex protein FliE n=1 Tax=Legionella sp. W05-934-2 TaxID=1198649 RepID=UPI003461C196